MYGLGFLWFGFVEMGSLYAFHSLHQPPEYWHYRSVPQPDGLFEMVLFCSPGWPTDDSVA